MLNTEHSNLGALCYQQPWKMSIFWTSWSRNILPGQSQACLTYEVHPRTSRISYGISS